MFLMPTYYTRPSNIFCSHPDSLQLVAPYLQYYCHMRAATAKNGAGGGVNVCNFEIQVFPITLFCYGLEALGFRAKRIKDSTLETIETKAAQSTFWAS